MDKRTHSHTLAMHRKRRWWQPLSCSLPLPLLLFLSSGLSLFQCVRCILGHFSHKHKQTHTH